MSPSRLVTGANDRGTSPGQPPPQPIWLLAPRGYLEGTSSGSSWDPSRTYAAPARTAWGTLETSWHGRDADRAGSIQQAIAELRRVSGLTWQQLAELFGVSRRAVHFWASGRTPNAEHRAMIPRVLDVVRRADRGSARANREALVEADGGETPLSLLASGRFEEAGDRLGRGPGRRRVSLHPLGAAAERDRRPPPPTIRIEERGEEPPVKKGRVRAGRTAKDKHREPSG